VCLMRTIAACDLSIGLEDLISDTDVSLWHCSATDSQDRGARNTRRISGWGVRRQTFNQIEEQP